MFTGDRSGQWLYGELYRQGLCNRADSVRVGDGLELSGVYIAAAGRCAPPGNKPLPIELDHCREYLEREIRALSDVRVTLALGKIAFDAQWRARRELGEALPTPKPVFGHGAIAALPGGGWLLSSYHPSQQNTSTGKLTEPMWRGIFRTAKRLRDRV